MIPLVSRISVSKSIGPVAIASSTTTNGTAVDLKDNNSAVVVFQSGTVTDGTFAPTIEESSDGGSTWTTVAAEDIAGTLANFTSTSDNVIKTYGYKGKAGQIRAVLTSSGVTTGALMAAYVILGNEKNVGGSAIIS